MRMSSSKTLAEWRKRCRGLEAENACLRQRVDLANACVLELAEKVERLQRKAKPDDQTLTKSIV